MSAGTIIACACKEIIIGKQSNLGPVDPQINGIPAQAVLAELEFAYRDMMANQAKQLIWNPILSRYTPSFVQQCQWAVENGKIFVGKFLAENMFAHIAEPEKSAKVSSVVDRRTDLSVNRLYQPKTAPAQRTWMPPRLVRRSCRPTADLNTAGSCRAGVILAQLGLMTSRPFRVRRVTWPVIAR